MIVNDKGMLGIAIYYYPFTTELNQQIITQIHIHQIHSKHIPIACNNYCTKISTHKSESMESPATSSQRIHVKRQSYGGTNNPCSRHLWITQSRQWSTQHFLERERYKKNLKPPKLKDTVFLEKWIKAPTLQEKTKKGWWIRKKKENDRSVAIDVEGWFSLL